MVLCKEIQVEDPHFGHTTETKVVNLTDRIKLFLFGYTYSFLGKRKNDANFGKFYIVKCDNCGIYYLDYPQGHDEHFQCPRCTFEKATSIWR